MDVDKKTGELSPKCPKCAHGGNVDLFPDKRMCMACGHVYPKRYLSDMESMKEGNLMDNQKHIEPTDAGLISQNKQDNYMKLAHAYSQLEAQLSSAQAEIAALKEERTMSGIHGQCMMEESDNEIVLLRRELEQTRATLATAEAEIRGAIKLCGEYAINAQEGLYASLALSIGRLKHQVECELAHKKKLSDCANSGIAANENLFDQLTEALAEIERLKDFVNNRDRHLLKCIGQKCDKDLLIEQMRSALEELVELKERRHSLPVEIYQESREKAWNKCRAAIKAAKGEV